MQHFLHLFLAPSYFQKSLLFAVISCQMVRLTLKHGEQRILKVAQRHYCSMLYSRQQSFYAAIESVNLGLNLYSSAGIATVAVVSTSILRNHTKSYGMAKAALAIATSPKIRRNNVAAVTNTVLVRNQSKHCCPLSSTITRLH